jgi:hypothetical protein
MTEIAKRVEYQRAVERRIRGQKAQKTAAATHVAGDCFGESEAGMNSIGCAPPKRSEVASPELFWAEINEVTWKLTDGVLARASVSGTLGPVSSPRALAWVMQVFPWQGHRGWHARLGDWHFGPTTIGRAKSAAEARLSGSWFEPDEEHVEREWMTRAPEILAGAVL